MRAAGQPEDQIAAAIAFVHAVHDAVLREDDYAIVESPLLQPARRQPWLRFYPVDEPGLWGLISRLIAEQYEPAATLARVHCPFLAVFGELDTVLPALKSAAITVQALREAGNPDATIVLYPQGNHRITVAEIGEMVPGYPDLLADWTARRVAAHA
jgi:pimeloyl-ACP methyl ester carboxylesterase